MVNLDIKELYAVLGATPAHQNVMLVGKHGIGKSEILTRFYSEKGMQVVALFLGQMSDPGDLIGLPRLDEETGKTNFMPPYWFPVDGKPIVLFLDELNRARPEILQTVMDLALNRKLAGRNLPEGSILLSAVNDGEEYQLTDLDPALVSRFNIYGFRPTVAEWLLWADKQKVDNRIVSFIQEHPNFLDGDEFKKADNGLEKTPDRRAWKKLSDCISTIDDVEPYKKLIAGIIGASVTAEFLAFQKNCRLISPKEILQGKFTKKTFAKYTLVDFSQVNESLFRYLEVHDDLIDTELISKSLLAFGNFYLENDKKEAFAHFVSLYENGSYPKAMSFIITSVPQLYDKIIKFISEL